MTNIFNDIPLFQVIPLFVEVALARLTREVKTSELRTMCLQVVSKGFDFSFKYLPSRLFWLLQKK